MTFQLKIKNNHFQKINTNKATQNVPSVRSKEKNEISATLKISFIRAGVVLCFLPLEFVCTYYFLPLNVRMRVILTSFEM